MKKMILFLFLCTAVLVAQWSHDPAQNLQISPFGYDVLACEDGYGGAFVAWTANLGPYLWLQWVDKYGYVKWPQPKMITTKWDKLTLRGIIGAEPGKAIIIYRELKVMVPLLISHVELIVNKIDPLNEKRMYDGN